MPKRTNIPKASKDGKDVILTNQDGSFRMRFDEGLQGLSILLKVRSCRCGECDWCVVGDFCLTKQA